jgi:hypothetical protein
MGVKRGCSLRGDNKLLRNIFEPNREKVTVKQTNTYVMILERSSISPGQFLYSTSILPWPLFFLIRIVVGGIQLDSLGTSATSWPIVPAPGDYEDGEFGGMMISWGNRSIYSEKTCPSATLSTTNPTWSNRTRTQAAALGSQRLTAWAMVLPAMTTSFHIPSSTAVTDHPVIRRYVVSVVSALLNDRHIKYNINCSFLWSVLHFCQYFTLCSVEC